jgi:proliferating cell nuclear antigen
MSTAVQLTIEPKVLFAYPSARDFTKILKTLSEIVDEAAFQVNGSGVHVKALDPSRIAMMIVDLPPEAFQEFNVKDELSIGLAVSNLTKILKNLKKGDRVVIAANEEYVEIVVEGASGARRYKFRNLSVLSEEIPELNPQYDVEALVLASPLRTSLKELTDITATVGISAAQDVLTFFDYDTKRSSFRLSTASGNILSLTIKKEVTAAFDSEYLSKFLEILSLSNQAEIKYGSEAPLNIVIEFSGGKAVYYLAAKI